MKLSCLIGSLPSVERFQHVHFYLTCICDTHTPLCGAGSRSGIVSYMHKILGCQHHLTTLNLNKINEEKGRGEEARWICIAFYAGNS